MIQRIPKNASYRVSTRTHFKLFYNRIDSEITTNSRDVNHSNRVTKRGIWSSAEKVLISSELPAALIAYRIPQHYKLRLSI